MQTAPAPSPTKDSSSSGGGSTTSQKSGKGASQGAGTAPVRRRPPEDEPTDYWSYELFGCLSDFRLCCATFVLPCYTLGRNAAYFGDDGKITALFCCLGLFPIASVLRWRIRQHRRLHGNMLSDVAVHCLCPCCAIVQENRELYGFEGSHIGEQLPLQGDISRQ